MNVIEKLPCLLPVIYIGTRKLNGKDIHYIPRNEKCLEDKPSALTDKEWEDHVRFWITERASGTFR